MIKLPKKISIGEAILGRDLRAHRIEFVPEHRFHPTRRWRFDFVILEHKIALEVEGAIWARGRHSRPKGILGDIEKYNEAQALGWKVYRFSTEQIKSGKAIEKILSILEKNKNPSF